jgi:hypothetical protein
MMDRNVQPGDRVQLPRGGHWLTGTVVLVKRRTWIHIEADDRIYRESLYELKEVADEN